MGAIFDYDGFLMQTLSKLFDLIAVNILWFIGCIPIVTVGASTTAMYAVVIKIVRGDSYGLWKTFWKSFRENFKQATVIWLIFLAVFVVLGVDFFFCLWLTNPTLKAILFAFFLFLTLMAVCMFLYVFPLQACFYNTIRQTIQNSLFFTLGNMLKTILMIVVDVLIVAASLFAVQAMSLFVGVLVALSNAFLMKKALSKYMDPPPEEISETEE